MENGEELKIVRANMPFGEIGKGEFGTYFIGYARSPRRTEQMLENMFVGRPPGNYDRLLDFSRAVTGTLFFVPTATFLDEVAPAPAAPAPAEPASDQPATEAPPESRPSPSEGSLGVGSLETEAGLVPKRWSPSTTVHSLWTGPMPMASAFLASQSTNPGLPSSKSNTQVVHTEVEFARFAALAASDELAIDASAESLCQPRPKGLSELAL